MEQKSLNLQQQALQTDYDLNRLRKSFALDKEEYRMGIKSKAQLEVSEDEYNYKVKMPIFKGKASVMTLPSPSSAKTSSGTTANGNGRSMNAPANDSATWW